MGGPGELTKIKAQWFIQTLICSSIESVYKRLEWRTRVVVEEGMGHFMNNVLCHFFLKCKRKIRAFNPVNEWFQIV